MDCSSLAFDGGEGANLGAHQVGVGPLTLQQLFVLPLLYHLNIFIEKRKRQRQGNNSDRPGGCRAVEGSMAGGAAACSCGITCSW